MRPELGLLEADGAAAEHDQRRGEPPLFHGGRRGQVVDLVEARQVGDVRCDAGGDDVRGCGQRPAVDVQGLLVDEAGGAVPDREPVRAGDVGVLGLPQPVDQLLLLLQQPRQVDAVRGRGHGRERVGQRSGAAAGAASRVLLGTQPMFRQVPPSRPCSTSTTDLPRERASIPAAIAAPPVPITTRSNSSVRCSVSTRGP